MTEGRSVKNKHESDVPRFMKWFKSLTQESVARQAIDASAN